MCGALVWGLPRARLRGTEAFRLRELLDAGCSGPERDVLCSLPGSGAGSGVGLRLCFQPWPPVISRAKLICEMGCRVRSPQRNLPPCRPESLPLGGLVGHAPCPHPLPRWGLGGSGAWCPAALLVGSHVHNHEPRSTLPVVKPLPSGKWGPQSRRDPELGATVTRSRLLGPRGAARRTSVVKWASLWFSECPRQRGPQTLPQECPEHPGPAGSTRGGEHPGPGTALRAGDQ